MKKARQDGILKIMIVVFALLAAGNAAEYFLITRENLKHIRSVVVKTEREFYKCGGRKYSYGYCEATIFFMENGRRFRISSDANTGDGYVDIGAGDTVDIFVRNWYQRIVTFGFAKQVYQLEKDGLIHYSMSNWKWQNFICMWLFALFAAVFLPLYLYQRSYLNKLLKRPSQLE